MNSFGGLPSPYSRFLAVATWAAVTAAACAHAPPSAVEEAGGKEEAQVVIGPAALGGGDVGLAAWMAYGITRTATLNERAGKFHNQSLDDYAIELQARQAMLDFWAVGRGDNGGPNPYLDALIEVRKAGFLEEYVFAFFARPGWTIPANVLGALDFPAFNGWARTHLAGHRPVSAVKVKSPGRAAAPAIPGATLPSPADLHPSKIPCAQSMPRVGKALKAWATEAAALDGQPLAAQALGDMSRGITFARNRPEYQGKGLTWVSPVVSELHYIAGFCAVEAHDLSAATAALEQAVHIDPLYARPRLELAHVLITEKKLDAADVHISMVIDTSRSPCDLGSAWRKRGFILVERSKMAEAYTAYQKSLEHDPASKTAVTQLIFIAHQARRLGGPEAQAFKDAKPPAVSETVVTECRQD